MQKRVTFFILLLGLISANAYCETRKQTGKQADTMADSATVKPNSSGTNNNVSLNPEELRTIRKVFKYLLKYGSRYTFTTLIAGVLLGGTSMYLYRGTPEQTGQNAYYFLGKDGIPELRICITNREFSDEELKSLRKFSSQDEYNEYKFNEMQWEKVPVKPLV